MSERTIERTITWRGRKIRLERYRYYGEIVFAASTVIDVDTIGLGVIGRQEKLGVVTSRDPRGGFSWAWRDRRKRMLDGLCDSAARGAP